MRFLNTEIKDVFIIEPDPFTDHRGSFSRLFCAREFKEAGLVNHFVQSNLSVTTSKNTIRGMHYQTGGAEEVKLVHCIRGRIMDVVIDIRESSATFGKHLVTELSEDNRMLYVPEEFAHGFLSLEDNCHVAYLVSSYYAPGKEKGIRWNDPFFGIPWPVTDPVISEKDRSYPDFMPGKPI
jgi:dTDP-4-dehydrorhamnose 3,5-epimerase